MRLRETALGYECTSDLDSYIYLDGACLIRSALWPRYIQRSILSGQCYDATDEE